MTKLKQPKIRFKGHINDWEKRKLGELAEISRGASPRPIQDPKWFDYNSDVGWLRISDVTEQNGRITYLEQKISKLGEKKTRVLSEPHLLLSIAATVGKPVINYVKTGVHDGFLIFYNPHFEQEFMFQWFEMFRPKWQKYGQSGSQVNLNSELVKNQDIILPNLNEQKNIGEFFKTLDTNISLHQQKLEVTKQFKQTMLKKMFPKNGKTKPEIRFKGFTDDWEECKLGDKIIIERGNLPSKTSEIDGKYPFFNTGSKKLYSNKYNFDYPHQVIVSGHGSVGNISNAYGKVGVSDGCYVLTSNNMDMYFLFIISEKYLSDYLNRMKTGTIISHTSKDDVYNCNILSPKSKREITLIAEYFRNLDFKIDNLKNKITTLNNLKNTMLRKMFI